MEYFHIMEYFHKLAQNTGRPAREHVITQEEINMIDFYNIDRDSDLKTQVYQRIRMDAGVSFVELKQAFPDEFGDKYKDTAMCHPKHKTILFWVCISSDMITALNNLIADGLIKMTSTSHMVYLMDGSYLSFPIATREYDYKREHWMPVVFNSVKRCPPTPARRPPHDL